MGSRRRQDFAKELRPMMYGFGDDPHPCNETVELVEDLVIDYLTELLLQAEQVSKYHGGKVRTEDLLFALRKDPKKHARVEELLFMNEELKRARKAFDLEDEAGPLQPHNSSTIIGDK